MHWSSHDLSFVRKIIFIDLSIYLIQGTQSMYFIRDLILKSPIIGKEL